MSTRLDPWGSGAVEIATRKVIPPGSMGLVQARPLATPPAIRKQPFIRLGPVTVHPSYSGVGPLCVYQHYNAFMYLPRVKSILFDATCVFLADDTAVLLNWC